MSVFIIGDIQGCLDPLKRLLDQVQFDPHRDQLWSVGDIINRGPDSLSTIRYLKGLGDSFKMVLGNHDLHLLAVAQQGNLLKRQDTFADILNASDRDELLYWLRQQPLIYQQNNTVLVHAGIPHIWPMEKALKLADEVQSALQSDQCSIFLSSMYGDKPDIWSDELRGTDRLRVITNYLTRMRICRTDGTLKLAFKSSPDMAPENFQPWFTFYSAQQINEYEIFFGHWAALESKCYADRFHALDSGCVWGNSLTVFELGRRLTHVYKC